MTIRSSPMEGRPWRGRVLSLAVLGVLCALPARALQVTPDALAFQHRPGRASQGVFTVLNDQAEPLVVEVESSPLFGFQGKEQLKIHPRRLTLAPGEKRDIRVSYRSKEPVSGERGIQVTFTAAQPQTPGVSVRLSHAVYIASENPRIQARVESFEVREKSPGRWALKAVVSNSGEVHVLSDVAFSIQGPNREEVARLPSPSMNVLYPGQKSTYEDTWESDQPPPDMPLDAWVRVYFRPPFGQAQKMESRLPLKKEGSR